MEDLLTYFYLKHINSKDALGQALCKLQPISVNNLTQHQLQLYSAMLIRNFFTYSAATMEIKLSPKHLLGINRLHKFEHLMEQNGIETLFQSWVLNQLMPFTIQSSKIPANCQYVYVDSKEETKESNKNKQTQEVELKRTNSKTKQKSKQKSNKKKEHSQKSQTVKVIANLNILELTLELQNRVLIKQFNLKQIDLKNAEKRLQYIENFKKIKIEQYINERFNIETLMVFNFIKNNAYADEKFLLNKTMLSAAELRKCIAHLVTEGLLNFYPENSRTMLFKTLSDQRMKQIYIDHIAQSILNLHIFLQKYSGQIKEEQKKYAVLQSLQNLDDILMIFLA